MSVDPTALLPLAPGTKLDRYELLCPLADGGMASVWIARQTGPYGFEKLVAIKTILATLATDVRFQRMFIDEVRVASRIEHVNVARILDVGEKDDLTYLVMEYVDGEALSKMHRASRPRLLPQGLVLRVMADVCGGLHAAHDLRDEHGAALGVVHRDVSPQNVLVSTRGVAKLIDFGIATARYRLAGDTKGGQLKGKPRYMSPEQALGAAVDCRADVWAVGAVLHHLLVGKPPHQGDGDMSTLLLLKSSPPAPELPSSVHPAVAAVVRRALSPAPDDRYATTEQMQQAIEDAMLEAGLATSTVRVAEYLEQNMSASAQERHDVIAAGLRAAVERDQAPAQQPGAPASQDVAPATATSPSGLPALARMTNDPIAVPAPPPIEPRNPTEALWTLLRERRLVVGGAAAAVLSLGIIASRPRTHPPIETPAAGGNVDVGPAALPAPAETMPMPVVGQPATSVIAADAAAIQGPAVASAKADASPSGSGPATAASTASLGPEASSARPQHPTAPGSQRAARPRKPRIVDDGF